MSRRSTEYQLIMAAICVVVGLGCASAIWPAVEHGVDAGLLAIAAAGLLGAAFRGAHRCARERHEDRADALAGRAWWAAQQRRHPAVPVEPVAPAGRNR
jgi:hypothetical protein